MSEGIFNPSGIDVQDEGSSVGTVDTLNFTGTGVSASVSGNVATVNVSGGGGGSLTITAVTVTLPYSSKDHSVTVTDAGISATSKIMVSLGNQLTADENAEDMVDLLGISTIAGTGSFTVNMSFLTPIGGPLKLHYIAA